MPVTIGPNRATTSARIVLRVFRTCFLLFLMPFAGIGLLVTIIAVINLIFGGITRGWLFTATFGAAFGGFGFWMMYLVFTSGKEQEIVFTRYAEHPNAPWMWRQDWASGRIESGAKASVVAPWVVAILWILISSPTAFIFIR